MTGRRWRSLPRWRRRCCWSPAAGARSRAARHGRAPRWRGSLLSAADFPPGVQFDRIVEQPGQPDGAGAPPSMLSRPEGCANALTNVIAAVGRTRPGQCGEVLGRLRRRAHRDDGAVVAAGSRQARGGGGPLRELRDVLRRSTPQGIPMTTTELARRRPGCAGLPADDAARRCAQQRLLVVRERRHDWRCSESLFPRPNPSDRSQSVTAADISGRRRASRPRTTAGYLSDQLQRRRGNRPPRCAFGCSVAKCLRPW